ncbi:unnamed protein product [Phytomonas sp. EM1]|nr:unnamed protein product [Phytomonas sp. EM1]|eukprot:CCW64148.1 unnamed protein product [Phytomonas sp. isolate EM1]
MLRRTSSGLFRRTSIRLSGGELYHPKKLEELPLPNTTKGFFSTYNGKLQIFRFLDIKWLMNRSVQLEREYYIAAPTFFFFLWMFSWKGFQIVKYGDGAPPRCVDWNTKETGYLPEGFTPTKVVKRV